MAYRTIIAKGDPYIEDFIASGTITPGDLVEQSSATQMRVHSTSGGTAERIFALESENEGKDVDDDYSTTTQVRVGIFRPGDCVIANLASGQNVSAGAWLESNGSGQLIAQSTDTPSYAELGSIVGKALEDCNASGAETRVLIRLL